MMPVSRESSGYSLSEMVWPLHHVSGAWQPPQLESPRHDLKGKSKKAWVDAWHSLLDSIVCRTRGEGRGEHDDDLPDPGSSPVTRVGTAVASGRLELGAGEEGAAAPAKTQVVHGVVHVGA